VPSTKLTEKSIARLRAPDPSGRQVLHWDGELRGFGVLCSGVTSTKTFIVQRALPGGKTRRVTIASVVELSLQEARDRAARLLLDMRTGIDPKAHLRERGGTLRQVLESYLKARGGSLGERSSASYRDLVTRHLSPWLDRPLKSISPDDVENQHRDISEAVEAAGRYSGHATANAAMRAFRVLWNYAADRDATLPASPTRRLKRQWYTVPARERHVRAAELPKFYAAVCDLPNPVARDYLLLLLFTGMRRREAAGLRWDDVDIPHRVIRLPAAKTKSRRKLALPMSDIVLGILMERQRLGRDKYVFPANGASGHIQEPKFPLNLVAEACGVRVSAHDLRRTYVTVAESADISPTALRALVNHSLGKDVTSGYVQMTAERLREPAQRVADKMRDLCGFAPPKGVAKLR
jgi:integrase